MAGAADKTIWLNLASRHLQMAGNLKHAGLYDGALFHTYHAFECLIAAGLAARGYDPAKWPKKYASAGPHVGKLNWFSDEYKGQPVAGSAAILRVHLCDLTGSSTAHENDLRNGCLYHLDGHDPPWIRCAEPQFASTFRLVEKFVNDYSASL